VQRLIFNKNFIEEVIQKVMSPMADLMVWQVDPFEILSSNGMHGTTSDFHLYCMM